MPFKNFSIWRGRLPHWRADDVTYYATFRHSRSLIDWERSLLLQALIRPEGRKWDLLVVCVLPDVTELVFTMREAPTGEAFELSTIVEKAKAKVGRAIVKKTGERFPPFYGESYDRIIRDAAELEERLQAIYKSPEDAELVEDGSDYEDMWVPELS